MSLIVGDCQGSVDGIRCMKIALVHDIAESIVGDITPHCGVSDAVVYSNSFSQAS